MISFSGSGISLCQPRAETITRAWTSSEANKAFPNQVGCSLGAKGVVADKAVGGCDKDVKRELYPAGTGLGDPAVSRCFMNFTSPQCGGAPRKPGEAWSNMRLESSR